MSFAFSSKPGAIAAPDSATRLAFDEHVAATILGVSAMTLRRDRRDGHLGIPFARIGGRVVYPRAALERWLVERTRPTPPAPPPPPVPVLEQPRRRRGRPTKAEQIARQRAQQEGGK